MEKFGWGAEVACEMKGRRSKTASRRTTKNDAVVAVNAPFHAPTGGTDRGGWHQRLVSVRGTRVSAADCPRPH